MDILFEQHLIQNTALAAETLWQAVDEAYETTGKTSGVPFPLAFVILPLTFHERSAKALASKTQPGALYKAIAEDREMTIGLQARMQAMSRRTFQALSLAFQSRLILLDPDHERHLVPGRRTQPVTHVTNDAKQVLNAAKRVGQAFAEMNVVQLTTHLNIRF